MSDLGYAYEAAEQLDEEFGKRNDLAPARTLIDAFLAAVAERGDWVLLLEHMGLEAHVERYEGHGDDPAGSPVWLTARLPEMTKRVLYLCEHDALSEDGHTRHCATTEVTDG